MDAQSGQPTEWHYKPAGASEACPICGCVGTAGQLGSHRLASDFGWIKRVKSNVGWKFRPLKPKPSRSPKSTKPKLIVRGKLVGCDLRELHPRCSACWHNKNCATVKRILAQRAARKAAQEEEAARLAKLKLLWQEHRDKVHSENLVYYSPGSFLTEIELYRQSRREHEGRVQCQDCCQLMSEWELEYHDCRDDSAFNFDTALRADGPLFGERLAFGFAALGYRD